MNKLLGFLITILVVQTGFSQDHTDYLVDENNTIIYCKIIQIKNGKVKYRLKNKSYSIVERINKFSDVNFNNPDVLKNPLGTKIEKPESGYAHVYFYFSGIHYKVKYNDEKLVKIVPGSYYLHKIKIGDTHKYMVDYTSDSKLLRKLDELSNYGYPENILEIFPEDQQIYIIKGEEKYTKNSSLYITTPQGNRIQSPVEIYLIIDNGKVSKYSLLSMKKKIS